MTEYGERLGEAGCASVLSDGLQRVVDGVADHPGCGPACDDEHHTGQAASIVPPADPRLPEFDCVRQLLVVASSNIKQLAGCVRQEPQTFSLPQLGVADSDIDAPKPWRPVVLAGAREPAAGALHRCNYGSWQSAGLRGDPCALRSLARSTRCPRRKGQTGRRSACDHRGMSPFEVLFVDEDRTAEQWGVRLIEHSIRRLTLAGPLPPVQRRIEGPHFVYEEGPDLFLGRRGRGPLLLAWDTNLLIDYFDHGAALWHGDDLPEATGEYGLQLEALQLVMALWVLRDVRIVLLPASISDARKQLAPERYAARRQAFAEFARAISLVADEDAPPPQPPLFLPEAALREAVDRVSPGGDRTLVEQAARSGAHVFLTRDDGVVKAAAALRPFGLVLATPQDLLELLAGAGALCCMLDPARHLYWPFPDLQRVTHLARAIPGLDLPGWSARAFKLK